MEKNKILATPNVGEIKGIKIYMYPEDHGLPHLHAFYGEFEAKYDISPEGKKVAGNMPPAQDKLILKYIKENKEKLEIAYTAIQKKEWNSKNKIIGNSRPRLISVIPQENFSLLLQYSNGERRQFFIQKFLTGTTQLKSRADAKEVSTDLEQFKTAKVEGPSVEWANGYDIDPEDLYENSTSMELVASIIEYPTLTKILA